MDWEVMVGMASEDLAMEDMEDLVDMVLEDMALAMAMVLDIMECGRGLQKKITNSDKKGKNLRNVDQKYNMIWFSGRRRHFWEDTEVLVATD